MADQPVIQTANLKLRPFRPVDALLVQKLAGVREVAETTAHIPHPYPDGAAESWIGSLHAHWHAGRIATFAIVRASDDLFIGAVGLVISANPEEAELGYWLGLPYWNQGHATEAAIALVTFGFETLNLKKISGRHLVRNPASGRIMQKLHMRFGHVQRESHRGGVAQEVAHYSINQEQWRLSMAADALRWISGLLFAKKIPFVVCGGLAAIAYGSERPLHDIDLFVPGEHFQTVVSDGADFTSKSAQNYCGEGWDLEYVQFLLRGIKIEVGNAVDAKIYSAAEGRWVGLNIDFENAQRLDVLARRL